jgi:hypothetical protein
MAIGHMQHELAQYIAGSHRYEVGYLLRGMSCCAGRGDARDALAA